MPHTTPNVVFSSCRDASFSLAEADLTTASAIVGVGFNSLRSNIVASFNKNR
jgi:hypothetical protein